MSLVPQPTHHGALIVWVRPLPCQCYPSTCQQTHNVLRPSTDCQGCPVTEGTCSSVEDEWVSTLFDREITSPSRRPPRISGHEQSRARKVKGKVDRFPTLCTFLLTLYATGALPGEIRELRTEDISFRSRRIMLQGNRIKQPRCIPICFDLRHELQTFAALNRRSKSERGPFFLTKSGVPISLRALNGISQRLRRIAGIDRRDGTVYWPRMYDLRATFAVHRITAWIKQGADLRMLPALAAYMGNVSLASTERYLSLTPERFRKELHKLSPQRGRVRWRDNPTLMKFLAGL